MPNQINNSIHPKHIAGFRKPPDNFTRYFRIALRKSIHSRVGISWGVGVR